MPTTAIEPSAHPPIGLPTDSAPRPWEAAATVTRCEHLLVASDGSRAAGAAIRLASSLALRDSAAVDVLAVFEPTVVPVPVGGVTIAAKAPTRDAALIGDEIEAVRRQVRAVIGGESWGMHVEFGRPGPTIARVAAEHGADLILLGLQRRGALARLFAAETALRVLRHTDRPVLAVEARVRTLPRRAVVGIDFGPSSLRAARIALALLDRPATLRLVHVRGAFELQSMDPAAWNRLYASALRQAMDDFVARLGAPGDVEVVTDIRRGNPPRVLLETARRHDADLIAVGSHSYPLLDRLLIGSAPTFLVHAAESSVLVVPPEASEG